MARASRIPLKFMGGAREKTPSGLLLGFKRARRRERPLPLQIAYAYKKVFKGICGAMSWKQLDRSWKQEVEIPLLRKMKKP